MAETGYSRSPRLLKGALVEFSERFIGPIPNVIIFQYNPESLARTLEPWSNEEKEDGNGSTTGDSGAAKAATVAQPEDPKESFDLELILDATDALEEPEKHPVAFVSGVADRIAALEMLLYPDDKSLLGELLGSITASVSAGGVSASLSGALGSAVKTTVPVVLFIFGPGLIVPVRLTSFRVEEQAFSPILYPIRAKVSVGLKVLRGSELASYRDGAGKDIAAFAYEFTKKQRQVLAAANLANSVESILGMLPL